MATQVTCPINKYFVSSVQAELHFYPLQIPQNKELEERAMIRALGSEAGSAVREVGKDSTPSAPVCGKSPYSWQEAAR